MRELQQRLRSTIEGNPEHSALMGERGIGKTSLLRKFQEIALNANCIVARVDLYPGIHDLEGLLVHVHEELRKCCVNYYSGPGKQFETVRNFLDNYSVTLPIAGGGIQRLQQRTLETSFRDRLQVIWSKVKDKAAAILVMVDEAETLAKVDGALEYFRNTFSRLGEDGLLYSVTICGKTGLFQTVTEAFSPLERFFSPITLNPFTATEAFEVLNKATLATGVKFDDDARLEINRESEGQPYVLQIFGYHAFDVATRGQLRTITKEVLEKAKPTIYGMLENQLFERRLVEGVGRSDYKRRIVKKLAQARPDTFSFSDIARISGVRKSQGLGVYLTELVEAGCLRKDLISGNYSFLMRIFKTFASKKLGS